MFGVFRRAARALWLFVTVVAASSTASLAFAQVDEPFKLIERLPGVEMHGPSEFAPIAAGPAHVVLFGHTDIALFRKSSGTLPAALLETIPVSTLFANAVPAGPIDSLTDPDVVFDPDSNRFFMAVADTGHTSGKLWLLLAVSKSSHPATLTSADWFVYRLERNDSGVDEADFDHLSIAGDSLLVSWQRTREIGPEKFGLGTTIRVFDKRPFVQGNLPAAPPIDLVLPSDRNIRARPASVAALDDRSRDRVFFDISSDCGDSGTRRWVIGAVSGLPANPVLTTREVATSLKCGNHVTAMPQKGSTQAVTVGRLAANPSYRDGRLWVFEWGGNDLQGTPSGIEWVQLDVRNWPDAVTAVQEGIYREPGVWLSAPAGIVDAAGTLVLTFLRSGSSLYPSHGTAGRLATDPPGTTRAGESLFEGLRAWDDTDRIATVLGAAPDFSDGSVWVSGITPTLVRGPGTKDSVTAWVGRLRPTAAPVVTAQPANQTVPNGVRVAFTAAASGTPAPAVQWQVSTNTGATFTDVTGATSTTYSFTAVSSDSGKQFRARFTNNIGAVVSAAATLTVTPPLVSLDRTALAFAAVNNGVAFASQTSPQTLRLIQTGTGTVTWTAHSIAPWLVVSPASGSGSATLTISTQFAAGLLAVQTGAIHITVTGAANTAGPVIVSLTSLSPSQTAPPYGVIETPAEGATGVTGSIPVTGWALDDVEVTNVRIARDRVAGEPPGAPVFIGYATLVDGARPDVQAGFPTAPRNSRAGWGYLLLTNFLPNLGNGTFRLTAIADDADGRSTELGSRTITCTNATATAPFGSIDTPAQGETISGRYHNFGWVLSPGLRRSDVPGGGQVRVVIDGVVGETPDGWVSREDLTALFPIAQFSGVANALAVTTIDTTALTNGVHTIAWLVTDNQGAASGIGSRYFTVSNGSPSLDPAQVAGDSTRITASARRSIPPAASVRSLEMDLDAVPVDGAPVMGRRGYDVAAPLRTYAIQGGRATVHAEEIDRIELRLSTTSGHRYSGYLRSGAALVRLPIGSSLNASSGQFTWAPGVGFVGTYDFVFLRSSGDRTVARQEVRIVLHPKGSNRTGAQVVIDTPTTPARRAVPLSSTRDGVPAIDVRDSFLVAGWAADLDARAGAGIDTVHVWAYPVDAGIAGGARRHDGAIFLGVADYGGPRPDIADTHGARFENSGFSLRVDSLAAGTYDIAVFAYSAVTQRFMPAKAVRVRVK